VHLEEDEPALHAFQHQQGFHGPREAIANTDTSSSCASGGLRTLEPQAAISFDIVLNGAEKKLIIQPQTIHLLSPSSGLGVGYGLNTLVCVSLPFRTIITPTGDEIVSWPHCTLHVS
jgi:hypothetical protein